MNDHGQLCITGIIMVTHGVFQVICWSSHCETHRLGNLWGIAVDIGIYLEEIMNRHFERKVIDNPAGL